MAEYGRMLKYYSQVAPVTDPGRYWRHLRDLPDDIPALCHVVQGLVIHDMWVPRYGIELDRDRLNELRLVYVEKIIARAFELDERPLDQQRPPGKRVIGCCRDFSVLLCSILRVKGIPARARCGFGVYLDFCDHWVCEYWDDARSRWVSVDAQMDSLQQDDLKIDFSVTNMPDGKFLVGGRAWQMCREEGYDPRLFGIGDEYRGLWFARGNLLRDLAALNKEETVPYLVGRPWDSWAILAKDDAMVSLEELSLLDDVAAVTQRGNEAFSDVQSVYEIHPELKPPQRWVHDLQARWFSETTDIS
jgi:hypothetical protein